LYDSSSWSRCRTDERHPVPGGRKVEMSGKIDVFKGFEYVPFAA